MRKRKDILADLVHFKADLSELESELSQYSWDSERILIISKKDFSNILKRGLKNEIALEDIVKWANAIECRDDLGFEVEEIQEIVFELANPEINGQITKERLQDIINELQEQSRI